MKNSITAEAIDDRPGAAEAARALALLAIWFFLVFALLASPATAQPQERVAVEQDWSVFEATTSDGKKVCWIVTQPTESIALRGAKRVKVRRGDIYLMVSVRPADGVKNEVSFLAGYPFKPGSEVVATVGSDRFSLFTEGENAWAPSTADDDAIVAAFRKGATAKIEGVSSRGTQTIDTFSLRGFTAALETAQKRCGITS